MTLADLRKMPEYKALMGTLEKDPWYIALSPKVQEKVAKYPPGLYKFNDLTVVIYSYAEEGDGSCKECQAIAPKNYNPGLDKDALYIAVKLSKLKLIKLSSVGDVTDKIVYPGFIKGI